MFTLGSIEDCFFFFFVLLWLHQDAQTLTLLTPFSKKKKNFKEKGSDASSEKNALVYTFLL